MKIPGGRARDEGDLIKFYFVELFCFSLAIHNRNGSWPDRSTKSPLFWKMFTSYVPLVRHSKSKFSCAILISVVKFTQTNGHKDIKHQHKVGKNRQKVRENKEKTCMYFSDLFINLNNLFKVSLILCCHTMVRWSLLENLPLVYILFRLVWN